MHPHFALRQRAGFVGTEHIHAAEVLDRGEPFHDHLLAAIRRAPWERLMLMIAGRSCGVSPTASASANSNESRTGFVEVNVESKDREDEHKGDLGQQVSESANATLEFGFRRAQS